MTDTFAPAAAATPTPAPRARKPRKRIWLKIAVPVTALIIGAMIGGSGKPAPEVITKTETVTKEVKVPVTPDACAIAFVKAEAVIAAGADTVGILSEGLGMAGSLDVTGLQSLSPRIKEQTNKVDELAPEYHSNKVVCLAASN